VLNGLICLTSLTQVAVFGRRSTETAARSSQTTSIAPQT